MSSKVETTKEQSPYAGAVSRRVLTNPFVGLLTGKELPPKRSTEERKAEKTHPKRN